MAVHQLHTEVEIEASAQRVWSVLSDFGAYPQWNPFVTSVVGSPQKGQRLEIVVQPAGGKAMRFKPVVLVADPGRELRWLGHFLLPGLFDGEHAFLIDPMTNGKVRFTQSERFSGLLVGLMRASLERGTKRGFEAMNLALKARAESNVR